MDKVTPENIYDFMPMEGSSTLIIDYFPDPVGDVYCPIQGETKAT